MYDIITVTVPGQPTLEVKLSTMIDTHARFSERPEEWVWLKDQVRDALLRLGERS